MHNLKKRNRKMDGASTQPRGENRIRREFQTASQGVSDTLRSGTESVGRVISEYPMSVLLASFALGAATGVFIGSLLIEPHERRWYERVPDSLGRRWLESLVESLPESVRNKVR